MPPPDQAESSTGQDKRLALHERLPNLKQAYLFLIVGPGIRRWLIHSIWVLHESPNVLTSTLRITQRR